MQFTIHYGNMPQVLLKISYALGFMHFPVDIYYGSNLRLN